MGVGFPTGCPVLPGGRTRFRLFPRGWAGEGPGLRIWGQVPLCPRCSAPTDYSPRGLAPRNPGHGAAGGRTRPRTCLCSGSFPALPEPGGGQACLWGPELLQFGGHRYKELQTHLERDGRCLGRNLGLGASNLCLVCEARPWEGGTRRHRSSRARGPPEGAAARAPRCGRPSPELPVSQRGLCSRDLAPKPSVSL